MRLTRTYRTKLNSEELNRNIRRNMSPYPHFSGNDFTHSTELHKALDSTKPLWYKTPYEHKLYIKSRSMLYWPRTEVIFNPREIGTEIVVKYKGAILAYILYGMLVTTFLGAVFYLLIMSTSDPSQSLGIIVFSLPLTIIPWMLRKIQTNIIRKLEYS